MAWIESHQSLSKHRKTLATAGRLSVDRHKLIGHLHELWWWALDNVGVDGEITGLTSHEIAQAADWDGDPDTFLEALIHSGFIDRVASNEGDKLLLHDWYDYAGKLIEKRLQERERSRRRREAAQQKTDGQPADNRRSTNGTVPYSTVPNIDISPSSTDTAKEEKTAKEARFDADSLEYALATRLRNRILENLPTAKVPDDTPGKMQSWCKQFDLMLRVDKRDPAEIEELIDWCQRDSFWRSNILSPKKLREKYDQLALKRQERSERGGQRGKTPEPPRKTGKFDDLIIR